MSPNKELSGKVALGKSPPTTPIATTSHNTLGLVTGSSRGIGAAIALKLAQRGAHLAINYITNAAAAKETAQQIRDLHGVKAVTIQADVSDETAVREMFERAVKEFGRLDLVVSNSGIEHFGSLDRDTSEDIDRVFAVNVKGQYFVAQMAFRYLESFGRVLLTSSISAVKVRLSSFSSPSLSLLF